MYFLLFTATAVRPVLVLVPVTVTVTVAVTVPVAVPRSLFTIGRAVLPTITINRRVGQVSVYYFSRPLPTN